MINLLKLQSTWKWRIAKIEMSQGDVAEYLNIDKARVSRIVNCHTGVNAVTMQSIEKMLFIKGEPFKLEYISDE